VGLQQKAKGERQKAKGRRQKAKGERQKRAERKEFALLANLARSQIEQREKGKRRKGRIFFVFWEKASGN